MQNELKKKAVDRLRRIEGQVRGLQKMVEDNAYCVDVIHQSFAVKSALSAVEDFILENHLSTHAAEQMRGRDREKAIREIIEVYKLSRKK